MPFFISITFLTMDIWLLYFAKLFQNNCFSFWTLFLKDMPALNKNLWILLDRLISGFDLELGLTLKSESYNIA